MRTAAQFQPSGEEVKAAAFNECRRAGQIGRSRRLVLSALALHAPATRNQLSDHASLPLSSVCGRCKELLDQGYIDVAGTTADRPARQMLELSADGVDAVAQMVLGEAGDAE